MVLRLVEYCHPPKSVAAFEAILSSFKEGRRDNEEFYLTLRGKFVHIQYYAMRSTDGSYLGTFEVAQDATHHRSLMGEKRLLERGNIGTQLGVDIVFVHFKDAYFSSGTFDGV